MTLMHTGVDLDVRRQSSRSERVPRPDRRIRGAPVTSAV
jgi:hypothetical protein